MLVGLHCKCGKRLKVPESRVGKSGTCPACHSPLRLVAPGFQSDSDAFDGILEIIDGPDRTGEVIFLGGPGPIEIGRHPEKHIVLGSPKVSRTHCRLSRTNQGWRVEDLKSTSGLFLNNRRIDACNLQDGNTLRIGQYEFRYHGRAEAAQPSPKTEEPAPFAAFEELASGSVTASAAPTSPSPDAADENIGPSLLAGDLDGDNLYRLSEGEAISVAPLQASTPGGITPAVQTGGPICPSCGRSLPASAKICITCGIDVKTGRAILTSHAADLDTIYENTQNIIWWISWIIWSGIYPVASEAFGVRKPHVIRAIAAITILTSVWFGMYDFIDSPKMGSLKNYMLWVGSAKPDPVRTVVQYQLTSYGDSQAFNAKLEELDRQQKKQAQRLAEKSKKDQPAKDSRSGRAPRAASTDDGRKKPAPAVEKKAAPAVEKKKASEDAEEEEEATDEASIDEEEEEGLSAEQEEILKSKGDLILAAHEALPPEKQCYGRYSGAQLITHAFLHGGLLHLAGNLLFLLVIGSRVNALVGNGPMIVLYPVLAIASGIVYMASEQGSSPHAMLGASGAIMGLSGMYLVLMPVHKVHMAAWLRWGLLRGFHLSFKMFAARGFWVVLFYIGFDVLYTSLGIEDNVAHWAHLGGFITGMVIGLLLLFTRLVNCRGGDIVSALLGKQAWALLGKPDLNRKAPLEYGW